MFTSELLLHFLNLLFIINILFAFAVVFLERKNPASTWTWLMVLLFLPSIGFILYLFLGQNLKKKKLFSLKKEEKENLTSIIDKQKEFLSNDALIKTNPFLSKYSDVMKLNLCSDNSFYTNNNNVTIFTDGKSKFDQLKKDLEEAKIFIHMEYYIFQNDNLGGAILEILCRKAKEGVEVKLLYDGMGCLKVHKNFFAPLIEAGGKVSCFFPPFLPYINLRVNFRNHRKICTIDGKCGYIGGFNIGDEYLGLSKKFGFWRDTHLFIQGDALDALQLHFLMDWRFASKENSVFDDKYFPHRPHLGKTGLQIVSSGPDSTWNSIKNGYLKMISKAEKNIYIETPYFIPDDSILEALRIASLSGVDVRIIIPSKPDHPFVYWASTSYMGDLLDSGVKCYTYTKGFLHSKFLSIDGSISSVGTANLDIRSFTLNFEINAFIYDKEITSNLDRFFIDDLKSCDELTLKKYTNRSSIVKFKESISRLLSPIL
ncbi:cardiolipin synthase [Clostridium estertheticum]|uniref:Cardiolipin synthase n=2 Tax=Clostridium estertheticum TaxID=238834 RepID=A0A1J0GBG0_9CLOT|nr:cardiolipin synthase [Clostridium estertheticum]APC38689.1 cardiolipin synthase [Clostridium estertheticum subsp. estertheticum]MBU3185503.1 cardiolipin synthase [Clostridium estertheticum]MBZ9615459.1 cardiolipin synthase [Clostridium estertheticum subsp. laramiense]MPQ29915.1 cardiolipin synthase [Clostridium estertheticum]MPQ60591.1 cardiolipin synthase [Clostridium estertheticum]